MLIDFISTKYPTLLILIVLFVTIFANKDTNMPETDISENRFKNIEKNVE